VKDSNRSSGQEVIAVRLHLGVWEGTTGKATAQFRAD